jgi:collagen type III alpha
MTSEGQYAGQQPAEATSGGAAEPYGPDGLPPDADGQRLTGRPPAPAARPPYPPGASSPPHPPAAPSAF